MNVLRTSYAYFRIFATRPGSLRAVLPWKRCIYTLQGQPWTPAEDKLLKDYVKHNGPRWKAAVEHCLPERTPNAVQIRWKDMLDPSIRRGPLDEEERQLLLQGVQELGEGHWAAIRDKYLPRRSSRQLANLWRLSLNPKYSRAPFTEQEDELIRQGVEKYRHRWVKIANELLPDRSPHWIRMRYVRVLKPYINAAPWTDEERNLLLRRTLIYGQKWKTVAEGLPGRTPFMCAYMWKNKVDPGLKKDVHWSPEETRRFWELTQLYSGNWARIAAELPGRNETMCYNMFYGQGVKVLDILFHIERQPNQTYGEWKRSVAELMIAWLDGKVDITAGKDSSLQITSKDTPSTADAPASISNPSSSPAVDENPSTTTSDIPIATSSLHTQPSATPKIKSGRWTQEEPNAVQKSRDERNGPNDEILRTTGQSRKDTLPSRNNVKKGERFSEAERELLQEGVAMFGHNWIAISQSYLPDRTPDHCRRVWKQSLYKAGKWSDQEDRELLFAVNRVQEKDNRISWSKVASMVQGRSPTQCRSRWRVTLQPGLKTGPWAYEEQIHLYEIVETFRLRAHKGRSLWHDVARELNTGRSSQACQMKYRQMAKRTRPYI